MGKQNHQRINFIRFSILFLEKHFFATPSFIFYRMPQADPEDEVLLEEQPYLSYININVSVPLTVTFTNEKPKELQRVKGSFKQAQVEFIDKFDQQTNWIRPRHFLMHTGTIEHTYDMDILDTEYLQLLKLLKLNIEKEDFQLLMRKFDLEWHYLTRDLIRSHIPDMPCQVCGSAEVTHNSNSIVYCDSCDLTAHQDCYGIPYICDGPFFCRKCILDPTGNPVCIFCNQSGGPMKRTRQNEWGHVICAFFIPGVFFANDVYLEPIDGIKKVHKDRWNLTCSICKQRGACIQCHQKGCFTAMHVYCAQIAQFCLRYPGFCDPSVNYCGYCSKHTPDDWNPPALPTDVPTTPTVPIPQELAKNPIMPQKIFEIATHNMNHIPNKQLYAMVKYWSLKRAHKGTALVRQLENEPRHINPNDKSKVLALKGELLSLSKVLEAVVKREQINLSLFRNYFRSWQLLIKPTHAILSLAIDRLKQYDPDLIFAYPVDDKLTDYYDFIASPMDLTSMEIKLQDSKYLTFEDFNHDVELIWKNAMSFNIPESIYYEAATVFKNASIPILKEVEDKWENYPMNNKLTLVAPRDNSTLSRYIHLIRDILLGREQSEIINEIPDREMNATPEHKHPLLLKKRLRSASVEESSDLSPKRLKRVIQSRATTPELMEMVPIVTAPVAVGQHYNENSLVWAKIVGFPFYPAIIKSEEMATKKILRGKKDGYLLVQFYDAKHSW